MQFRIYYADGSAFGSDQGSWEDAPKDGVIMVAINDGSRTEFLSGSDYYVREPDSETFHRQDNLEPYVRKHNPEVKFGVWTTHSMYERIQQRAREEFAGEDVNPARKES